MIAARLGGERVPVNGRGETSDIDHPWLAAECKRRKEIPQWIKDALKQAKAGNITGEKLPIVIVHEAGSSYDECVVSLYLKDFEEWFGDR